MKQKRPTPPANTVIGYCRVSTDAQERDGTSLETQEAACRQYAERQGWHVVDVIRDTASGATLERPGLDRLREMVRQGKASLLLCYASDRLSRDQWKTAALLDDLEKYGARLVLVTEDFDNSPTGKLILNVRSYAAEVEREKIRERTVRGKKAKLAAGKLVGAGKEEPFGYVLDRETWRRVIVSAEAAIVERIYRLCTADKLGCQAIAVRLHADGSRTREGTIWRATTVWRILKNPAYKGETLAWLHQTIRRDGQKETIRRPAAENIRLPEGVTPAIVTPEVWADAQAVMAVNKGEKARNQTHPELLRGLVYCGKCGKRCYPRARRLKTSYVCADYGAVVRCNTPSIQSAALETLIWRALKRLLRSDALIARAQQRHRERQPKVDTRRLDEARAALAYAERQREELYRKFVAGGGLGAEFFQRDMGKLERDRTALAATVAELERQQQAAASGRVDGQAAAAREWRERWLQNLEGLDFDGRRDALLAFALRAFVAATTIRLEGSLPVERPVGINEAVAPRASTGQQHNGPILIPFSIEIARPKTIRTLSLSGSMT